MQDVFDTNYKAYLMGMLNNTTDNAYAHVFRATAARQKYVIGIAVDDTDWFAGFGAGPEFITSVDGVASSSDHKKHQHAGIINLYVPPAIGAYNRAPATGSGLIYGDPRSQTVTCMGAEVPEGTTTTTSRPADTVCNKFALAKYLRDKYGTIEALNAAWGSSYTTFESSGTVVSNQSTGWNNQRDDYVYRDYFGHQCEQPDKSVQCACLSQWSVHRCRRELPRSARGIQLRRDIDSRLHLGSEARWKLIECANPHFTSTGASTDQI